MSSLLGIASNCITTDFYETGSTGDVLVNDFIEAKKDKFTLVTPFEGLYMLESPKRFLNSPSYLESLLRVHFCTSRALSIEALKPAQNKIYQLVAYNLLNPFAAMFDLTANMNLNAIRGPLVLLIGLPFFVVLKANNTALKFFNLTNHLPTPSFTHLVLIPIWLNGLAMAESLLNLIEALLGLIHFSLFNKLLSPLENIFKTKLPGHLIYNKNEEKIEFIIDIERLKYLKNKVKLEGITEEDIIEFSKDILVKHPPHKDFLLSFEIRGDELIISAPMMQKTTPIIRLDNSLDPAVNSLSKTKVR